MYSARQTQNAELTRRKCYFYRENASSKISLCVRLQMLSAPRLPEVSKFVGAHLGCSPFGGLSWFGSTPFLCANKGLFTLYVVFGEEFIYMSKSVCKPKCASQTSLWGVEYFAVFAFIWTIDLITGCTFRGVYVPCYLPLFVDSFYQLTGFKLSDTEELFKLTWSPLAKWCVVVGVPPPLSNTPQPEGRGEGTDQPAVECWAQTPTPGHQNQQTSPTIWKKRWKQKKK